MQKLVWKNSLGDEINLTSGNYGITQWEGFSNASLNIQSQQVPFQDGGVFLDALLNQRELSVTLKMQDNGNLEERYRMRRELIHSLNPKLGEGYLIYTNDFISKRIKCVAQIPLFETHNSNDSGTPKASLAWTACEPYWEDLEETVVTFSNGETKEITNNGDIKTQIKASITDIENEFFTIDNRTSEQNITSSCDLTGDVSINTEVGQKNITLDEPRFGDLYGGLGNGGVVVDNLLIVVGGMVVKINTKTYKRESLVTNLNVILNDIAYSPTLKLYVAISNTQIFSSKDLINWTEHSTSISIRGDIVSWENNVFKTNAISSGILTSEDGITWTQTTGSINKSKTQCQFKGTYYRVATVSNKGVIQQSLDGSVWTTIYNENSIDTLVVSENYLYAIGKSMAIIKTKNGTNWDLLYKGYNLQKSCVAFNKVYYYTDNSEILIFEDEKLNVVYTINEAIFDIFFQNDRLLILTKTKIYLSMNGSNFAAVKTLPYEVAYGNIFFNDDEEKYCVYFDGNVFLSSYNGYDWEEEGFHSPLPYERLDTPYMAYFDGNYFIGCSARINGYYYRCIIKTSDLESFDTVYLETNIEANIIINGMYADENYVVMYGDQKIVKSSDGVNFISNIISQEMSITDIKKIDNLYYITGTFPYFYETQNFSNLIQKVIPTVETRCFIGLDIINDTMYLYGIFNGNNLSGFFGKNIPFVKNIINCLTNGSNMDFCLVLGKNTIYFDSSNNSELKIKFRQKYIGV